MLKTQSKLIGNTTYHVTALPSTQARHLFVRLSKMLGPSLATLMQGKSFTELKDDISNVEIGPALSTLCQNLSEKDFDYIVEVLGAHTQIETNGAVLPLTRENQELHFADKFWDIFLWVGFALEVNYAGPFVNSKLGKSPPIPTQKPQSVSQRD